MADPPPLLDRGMEKFQDLYDSPEFSDITIIIPASSKNEAEHVKIHAHKIVLGMGSRRFRNYLKANPTCTEVSADEVGCWPRDQDAMAAVLQYFYCLPVHTKDEVPVLDLPFDVNVYWWAEICMVAEALRVPAVRDYAAEMLEQGLKFGLPNEVWCDGGMLVGFADNIVARSKKEGDSKVTRVVVEFCCKHYRLLQTAGYFEDDPIKLYKRMLDHVLPNPDEADAEDDGEDGVDDMIER